MRIILLNEDADQIAQLLEAAPNTPINVQTGRERVGEAAPSLFESARSTIRLDLLSSLASQEGVLEEAPTAAGEVTRRILAIYEAGGLVTMCAWCRRVEIDGEWSLAPRQALSAIEARYTLSHSICPTCTLEADQPPASV